MKNPNVLGRFHDNPNEAATERSQTGACPEISVPYEGAASGTARVQIFTSSSKESHGGVVLKFSIENEDCSFIPAAKVTDSGIEMHISGDAEAAALITALRGALAILPEPTRYKITEF